MAELVDASDLKSLGEIRPGSTPGVPTGGSRQWICAGAPGATEEASLL